MLLSTLLLTLTLTAAPPSWSCGESTYGDGVCDCGCGAADTDCGATNFKSCERSGCTGGQVPWEHQNASCMASTCGDGWKSETEVCDDGNALASGGCGAGCSAVNSGYECGERALGCKKTAQADGGAPDAGSPTSTPDAGTMGESPGTDDRGESEEAAEQQEPVVTTPVTEAGADRESGGCSAVPAGLLLASALFIPGLFRRRVASQRR